MRPNGLAERNLLTRRIGLLSAWIVGRAGEHEKQILNRTQGAARTGQIIPVHFLRGQGFA
jgi:hypothetical protein